MDDANPALAYRLRETPTPSLPPRAFAWVERAGKANIGDFVISGGYFYFGTGLVAVSGRAMLEPALVNPTLPIDFAHPDWTGEGLHYWPSYDRLSPGERAAYVSWLASPRDSPSTPTGFVFLYFYGLERHALVDVSPLKDSHEQLILIASEVKRLRYIYTGSRSFNSYSSDFLDVLNFLMSSYDLPSGPPPQIDDCSRSFPPLLKFGLGHYAHEGIPIPAYWAFEWAKTMPTSRIRYSKTPDELKQLFTLRYQERYGDGIVLKPQNDEASVSYRPASASFGGVVQFKQAVPDVTLLTSQAEEIETIASHCRDELGAYSRYVTKHPEGRDSLAAAAILPHVLVHNDSSREVEKFVGWVRAKLGNHDMVVIDGIDLISQWPSVNSERFVKHEAVSMAELLSTFSLGFEPDVRFSGPVVGPDKAVLFHLGARPSAPGAGWTSASAVLQMTANLISSSRSNEIVLDRVTDQLQSALRLDPSQHNRVRAHLLWGTLVKMSVATTKHALANVDATTKKSIGDFLIDVAATSGELGPKQVTALTTAFKILDLEPTTIYSLLHERSTQPAVEPIEVRSNKPTLAGEAIPPENKRLTADMLNQDVIRAKLAESARATALLGDIFADADDDEMHPESAPANGNSTLNPALKKLAEELSRQNSWTSDEFTKLTKECGLLPSGAVESLNDHALDLFGEPLLEGGENIEVNQTVLEEMLT